MKVRPKPVLRLDKKEWIKINKLKSKLQWTQILVSWNLLVKLRPVPKQIQSLFLRQNENAQSFCTCSFFKFSQPIQLCFLSTGLPGFPAHQLRSSQINHFGCPFLSVAPLEVLPNINYRLKILRCNGLVLDVQKWTLLVKTEG